MAENVTGQIGSDQVNLENAATEATLKLLIQATLATTKEQKKAIADLVQKAGLDPVAVEEANKGLTNIKTASGGVASSFDILKIASDEMKSKFLVTADVIGKLTSGAGQASDVFGSIALIGGPIGLVATAFQKLAQFQEEQLANYQKLTDSGINFNGSLTDMRKAASDSYLTMEQFTGVMTKYSGTFARLGGTAEDGALAFTKMSNSLLKSKAGDDLRALGFTAEQVNDGLAGYLQISGTRGKMDAETSKKVTESAAEYMEQLNGLAEITGKSRKALDDEIKEKAANAAWLSATSKMGPEEAKKAALGLAQALSTGGQGAADAYQAQVMGVAVQTDLGKKYTAMYGEAAEGTRKSANMVRDSTKTSKDMQDQDFKNKKAQVEDGKKYGDQLNFSLIKSGGALAGLQQTVGTANVALENMTKEQYDAAMAKQDLDGAEAKAAADTQKAVQEMGQGILNGLMPVFKGLLMILNPLVTVIGWVVGALTKIPFLFEGLGAAIIVLTGLYVLQKTAMRFGGGGKANIVEKVLDGGGGGGKKAGGGIGGALSGIGKGAGKGLEGLAKGLGALGKPNVLLGVVALIGIGAALYVAAKAFQEFTGIDWVQVGIGTLAIAGIAAAAALAAPAAPFIAVTAGALLLLGGALWAMAAGLKELSGAGGGTGSLTELGKALLQFEIDTPYMKLGAAAIPLAAFGASLFALSAGLKELQNLDAGKLNELSKSLVNIKDALPPERSLADAAGGLIKSGINALGKAFGGDSQASVGGADGKNVTADSAPANAADPSEILTRELKALNKQTETLVKAMREAADSTAKTASLIASNGNLFRA